jgi:hypothetical protein
VRQSLLHSRRSGLHGRESDVLGRRIERAGGDARVKGWARLDQKQQNQIFRQMCTSRWLYDDADRLLLQKNSSDEHGFTHNGGNLP